MIDFARSVAVEAAREQREAYLRGAPGRVELKGRRDLVTDVDRRLERRIAARIAARCPDDAILAEESIRRDGRSGRVWVVDPLDGTTNFVHGHPLFAVSIALAEGFTGFGGVPASAVDARSSGFFALGRRPRVVVAVVVAPILGEIYRAEIGSGAWIESLDQATGDAASEAPPAVAGRRLSVSPVATLRDSLVATGFAYRRNELRNNNLENFAAVALRAQGIRRGGSACLDLCFVAAGRFEAFWELYLKPWDVAAGMLLVEEAGGRVSDLAGGSAALEGVEIVASNGRVHEELREMLLGADPEWAAAERRRMRETSSSTGP